MTAAKHTRKSAGCGLVASAAVSWLMSACTGPAASPTPAPPAPPPVQAAPSAVKAATPSPQATPTAPKPAQPAGDSAKTPQVAAPKLTRDQMCEGICARSSELRCEKADRCPKMCAETMQIHVCESELEAATRCTLSHPASDWQCSRQGVASIKDPFCVEEQRAFGNCLIANSPPR